MVQRFKKNIDFTVMLKAIETYIAGIKIKRCILLCMCLFQTVSLIAQEKQVIEAKIVDEVSGIAWLTGILGIQSKENANIL